MTASAASPPIRRWSLAHLALLVPWIAVVVSAWAPIRDNSFLWHVRAGSLQVEAGHVITEDPFSFTMAGERWLTQSWLAELFYAWGESIWGLGFVSPMRLVLNTLIFSGIALLAYRYSRSVSATGLVALLSTGLLISFMVPRPVIFSFLLFVGAVLAWDRPQTRWALPFIFWIWAAVHGSFLIGLGYVGLRWIMDREWRTWPVPLISGLATLATAHGLGVVRILLDFSQARDVLPLLTEWREPELLSFVFLPFVIGVVVVLIGAFRGLITPRHVWLVAPFLLLGLTAVRAVPPAWFGLLPLVALSLTGLSVGEARRFSAVGAGVFVVIIAVLPFLIRSDGTLAEERFPVEAVTALEDVRTFHDDSAGGYLTFVGALGDGVYIDDRAELYRDRVREFLEVRSGSADWEPVFVRDGIQQALLSVDEPLLDELTRAGWRVAHQDEHFMVLLP